MVAQAAARDSGPGWPTRANSSIIVALVTHFGSQGRGKQAPWTDDLPRQGLGLTMFIFPSIDAHRE